MLPVLSNGKKGLTSWLEDMDHAFSQHWQSLMDNFFKPNSMNELKTRFSNSSFPRVDIYTQKDTYNIEATVPGVNPDDLLVEVFEEPEEVRSKSNLPNSKFVRITGQMSEGKEDANFHYKELRRSKFIRTLRLPDDVVGDPDAEIKDGILRLTWKTAAPVEIVPETKVITLKKG